MPLDHDFSDCECHHPHHPSPSFFEVAGYIAFGILATRGALSVLSSPLYPSASSAKPTQEGEQTNNNFLGGCCLVEAQGDTSKPTDATHNKHHGDVAVEKAAANLSFGSLCLFRFSRAPRRHNWRKVLSDWRECRHDFLVVGVDGFCFMVRNTRFGRFIGLSRLCIWHGAGLPSKLSSIGGGI